VRVCPAAGDEVALPAKQRLRLERESRPRRLGSERLSDASSVRSARVSFAARPVGGGSPAHAGGRGSPTPSSDAAAPTATPVVTGSGQRDTPTTRANSPPSTTARETNLAIPTLGKAADEFANPTPSNQRDRVPRAHETPWLTRSEKDAPTVLDCPRRLPTSDRPRTEFSALHTSVQTSPGRRADSWEMAERATNRRRASRVARVSDSAAQSSAWSGTERSGIWEWKWM
jgi:hypothetical protein